MFIGITSVYCQQLKKITRNFAYPEHQWLTLRECIIFSAVEHFKFRPSFYAKVRILKFTQIEELRYEIFQPIFADRNVDRKGKIVGKCTTYLSTCKKD
jgi:hypothetical protein